MQEPERRRRYGAVYNYFTLPCTTIGHACVESWLICFPSPPFKALEKHATLPLGVGTLHPPEGFDTLVRHGKQFSYVLRARSSESMQDRWRARRLTEAKTEFDPFFSAHIGEVHITEVNPELQAYVANTLDMPWSLDGETLELLATSEHSENK